MPENHTKNCTKPKITPFLEMYTLKKVVICSLNNNTKITPRIAITKITPRIAIDGTRWFTVC